MFSKTQVLTVPLFLVLALSMSACHGSHAGESPLPEPVADSECYRTANGVTCPSDDDDAHNAGGLGMTYTGKIGIDLGGGIVMPMGGGMPQMGMGF